MKNERDKAIEDFQRRFSEFMAKETGEGKPVEEFVLFYLLKEEGGGVVQSFSTILEAMAYTAHLMSTVLRKSGTKLHKAFVTKEGKMVGELDLNLKEGIDDEQKPN